MGMNDATKRELARLGIKQDSSGQWQAPSGNAGPPASAGIPASSGTSKKTSSPAPAPAPLQYDQMTNAQRDEALKNYVNQGNENLGTSLVDWGKQNNIGVSYDPQSNKTVINGVSYDIGHIPGTTFSNGTHYVSDQDTLNNLAGITQAKKKDEEMTSFWDQFKRDYAPKAPVMRTPDLSTFIESTKSQLEPILATQLANLGIQRKKAQENAENDLKRRGFFGQLPSIENMNELNSEYDNSEASLRANFLQNVLGQAFPLYSQSLAQEQQAQQTYDQNMLNLGLAIMNGMIDQNKFIFDDAYRTAMMARLGIQDLTSNTQYL